MRLRYPLALFVLVALGLAGNGDFEEEQAEAARYAERVCSGVHGDYLNFSPDC
tara:strand:- start:39 stop:197 length:159 start_codon:yes stop_codon:yes gene_type:complete